MDDQNSLPYISAASLEALKLSASDVIGAIEYLLIGQKEGKVWNAPKATIYPPDDRFLMATLTCADDPPFMSVKALLLNPHNPTRGLDQIQSLVTLMDSQTGRPCAVLDGNWITAVRTAGLSAVAAKRLARPESTKMAFIGCGTEARSHLRAFAELFPLQEIGVFGRGRANIDLLCRLAEELGLRALPCVSARDAVAGADIVVSSVTLSPRPAPFLDARWLKPGAFASMIDLGIPWAAEGMSSLDRIFIDDLEQEAHMMTPMVEMSLVSGDLAGLVQGRDIGRTSHDERTAFVFRGLGIGDLAVAALAFQRSQMVS